MKKVLFIALMAMMAVGMAAQNHAKVPAYRGMREIEQPDGYKLRTYKHGDEHYHFAMTEDGWQIKTDSKGWMKYAKTNCKGEVVCHWRKARNAEDRSKYAKRWLKKHGINKMGKNE